LSRRFAVAFSYAGEDRARVAPVAEALAQRFGRRRVLYDRFHEAEFARPGLDVYLPPLYRDQSELIVVVLSPDYPRKAWCGLELRWIRQLLLGPGSERIMLLSLGDPGDLSSLGLLPGDGYLEVSRRPTAEVVARILERLALQGVALPEGAVPGPASGAGRRPRLPPKGMALLAAAVVAAGALAVPLAWRLVSERQARSQLAAGDQAFSKFDKAYAPGEQDLQLRRAEAAWGQAARLAPALAEPRARLAFLHDLRGELPQAEAAWRQALDLEPSHTSAARAYRIGRAGVLAQLPGRAPEALALYEADPDHPRAAVELAMLRWGEPAALARALDAVSRPELAASLSGGSAPSPGWSFPLPGRSELLVFNRRNQQRCVLQAVRATTAHLRGAPPLPPSPLATPDCQGGQLDVRELLCLRLPRPAANPRATLTARWLGCPAGGLGGGRGDGDGVG
jgi:tetratricopeptide (TPR) repeat protein